MGLRQRPATPRRGLKTTLTFERLKALLCCSEPADWEPQVDRDEAAKLAARWGWMIRRVRERGAETHENSSQTTVARSERGTPKQGDAEPN
jgi:hypothetical protein